MYKIMLRKSLIVMHTDISHGSLLWSSPRPSCHWFLNNLPIDVVCASVAAYRSDNNRNWCTILIADTSDKNSKVKNIWHISVSDACMYSVCGCRNSTLKKCHMMSYWLPSFCLCSMIQFMKMLLWHCQPPPWSQLWHVTCYI